MVIVNACGAAALPLVRSDERLDLARTAGFAALRGRRPFRDLRQVEQAAEGFGVEPDGVRVADRLQLFGRADEQLLDEAARDVVHLLPRVGRKVCGEAFEL